MSADLRDIHIDWIEHLQRRGLNLTAWEIDFIESLQGRLDRGLHLTEKQAETLEEIHAKRTP